PAALPPAIGLPAGLNAPRSTSRAGSTRRYERVAGSDPAWGAASRAYKGWVNSWPWAGSVRDRQSPAPLTSAYEKSWVQCWSWNAAPSGRVRLGGSIQTPDGQPVQDRISDRCSAPVTSTAKPGSP